MIKAFTKTTDGRRLVLLGMSRGNAQRMLDGHPVYVDLQEPAPKGLGIPGGDVIGIVGGDTEASILAELRRGGLNLPDEVIGEPSETAIDLELERKDLASELRMVVDRLKRLSIKDFAGSVVEEGGVQWQIVVQCISQANKPDKPSSDTN